MLISVTGLPESVWGDAEKKLRRTVDCYANRQPYRMSFANGEAVSVRIEDTGRNDKLLIARTRLERLLFEEVHILQRKNTP